MTYTDLNHPCGPAWAVFQDECFVGFSFGHDAAQAIDLYLDTMESGERRWKRGPWSAVREDEALARGMIGAAA